MTAVSTIPAELRPAVLRLQRQELTQYHICQRLAELAPDGDNCALLKRMAADEARHHAFWQSRTGTTEPPDRWRVNAYVWLARVFGLTFSLKLLEQSEQRLEATYAELARQLPDAAVALESIRADEKEHEEALLAGIQEQRLDYIGSVVLGVSDALVELTGALAGFTLALQQTKLIAAVGLITGIAAALSMAASEYLSVKSERGEGTHRRPLTAAFYTGGAYLFTVALLTGPYLLLDRLYVALGWALAHAMLIILVFTFYQSVVYGERFRAKFLEMAGLTLGVATISYGLGWLVRLWFGVEV